MKPLSPKDLKAVAGDAIPEFVIEAVNNLLKKEAVRGYPLTLRQCDIIKEIRSLLSFRQQQFGRRFDMEWLDFEPVFRRQGWIVVYDKPGYNESYEPTFEFKPKRK